MTYAIEWTFFEFATLFRAADFFSLMQLINCRYPIFMKQLLLNAMDVNIHFMSENYDLI